MHSWFPRLVLNSFWMPKNQGTENWWPLGKYGATTIILMEEMKRKTGELTAWLKKNVEFLTILCFKGVSGSRSKNQYTTLHSREVVIRKRNLAWICGEKSNTYVKSCMISKTYMTLLITIWGNSLGHQYETKKIPKLSEVKAGLAQGNSQKDGHFAINFILKTWCFLDLTKLFFQKNFNVNRF